MSGGGGGEGMRGRIRKILRAASLGSNFTGSYKKAMYRCEVQETVFSKFFSLFFYKNKRLGFGKKI